MNKCVKIMKTDVNFFQKDFTQGGSNIFETTMLRVQTNVQATVFNIFCGGGGGQQMFETEIFRSQTFCEEIYFGLLIKKIIFECGGGIFFQWGTQKCEQNLYQIFVPHFDSNLRTHTCLKGWSFFQGRGVSLTPVLVGRNLFVMVKLGIP